MTKQTYRVTGNTAYRGHQPGETFDADLTDDEKRRAIDRGSIAAVSSPKKTSGKEGAKDA
jgi:hypothetical protein